MTDRNLTNSLFFYIGNYVVTLKADNESTQVIRSEHQLLAERSSTPNSPVRNLATTLDYSIIHASTYAKPIIYTCYGYTTKDNTDHCTAGFHGYLHSGIESYYLMGNGYRLYTAALMRFISSDYLSPFGMGGINSYAFAHDDPVNNSDPTGQFTLFSRSRTYRGSTTPIGKIHAFMAKHPTEKGKQAITIMGHGNGTVLKGKDGTMSGRELIDYLKRSTSLDTKKHDIHLISCHSAGEIMEDIYNTTGRPVYGYQGSVAIDLKFNFEKSTKGRGMSIGISVNVLERSSSFARMFGAPKGKKPISVQELRSGQPSRNS